MLARVLPIASGNMPTPGFATGSSTAIPAYPDLVSANQNFFPYGLDKRWALLFGVLRVDESDGVELTEDGQLRATYGRFVVETPLSNIEHTQVTADHRWYTAVGPRLSFADDGLTFGTNHASGLCIEFVEKIPKVIGLKDHSALWVSVADPEGLATAIGR